MKIHFFYSNTSSTFYAAKLQALLEEDVFSCPNQRAEKRFQFLETIRIHICKTPLKFHSVVFDIEFGRDNCCGDWAKSVDELYKARAEDYNEKWRMITQYEYERIRKRMFAIYQKNSIMDFSLVTKGPQPYSASILF